jgi:hypothetical protein
MNGEAAEKGLISILASADEDGSNRAKARIGRTNLEFLDSPSLLSARMYTVLLQKLLSPASNFRRLPKAFKKFYNLLNCTT